MKKKLLKGFGILVMAGCLITAVGKNVGAAENTANDVVNEGGSSTSGDNIGGSSDTSGGSGTENGGSGNAEGGSSQGNSGSSGTMSGDVSGGNSGSGNSGGTGQAEGGSGSAGDDTVGNASGSGSSQDTAGGGNGAGAAGDASGNDGENEDASGDKKEDADSGDAVKGEDTDTDLNIEEGKISDESGDPEEKSGEEVNDGDVTEGETLEEGEKESETEPEETLPEETLPEETVPETTAAQKVKESEYLTMEDIAGTWTIDDITTYKFNADGTGALILPKNKYSFKYTLKENELKIDFENKKLRDSTYKVALTDGVLTLQCTDEYFENEFTLEKIED